MERHVMCNSCTARFWYNNGQLTYEDGYSSTNVLIFDFKSLKYPLNNVGIGLYGHNDSDIEKQPYITLVSNSEYIEVKCKVPKLIICIYEQ